MKINFNQYGVSEPYLVKANESSFRIRFFDFASEGVLGSLDPILEGDKPFTLSFASRAEADEFLAKSAFNKECSIQRNLYDGECEACQ